MSLKRLIPFLTALGFALSLAFAVTSFWTMDCAKAELNERREQLATSENLLSKHPELFNPTTTTAAALKPLVQESSTRNGISLAYLSESEKEAGEGLREINVLCRAVNVEQANLVRFLADLEARGGGAFIKELRLKPASDRSGKYQEAETILTCRWATK